MKTFSAPELRNIAVAGHNTVGKTTLIAALLYAAGATTRPGRIDDGTCPTDFDTEEIERKISINLACAHAIHRDVRINFIDAPGSGIFSPEEVRTGSRRAPDPDRRGEGLQGDRGPRPDGGPRQRRR